MRVKSMIWTVALYLATLSEYILEFEAIYEDLGITMPIIEVGEAVAYRASYTKSRARIFQDALNAVQPLDLGGRYMM